MRDSFYSFVFTIVVVLIQTVTVLSSEDDLSDHQIIANSTCKMLDCDTISQAKAKAIDFLYVNTPFSLRPKVNEIDLGEFKVIGLYLMLADA